VPEAGGPGKKNGELLSLAENAGFQGFLDQGIEFQQNLRDAYRCNLAPRQVKPTGGLDPFGTQDFDVAIGD
jgi:hypothetical protein